MKKFLYYILTACLIMIVGASCEDNDNWRIIPYEPEIPEGPSILYVVGNHQGWNPSAETIGQIYSINNDGIYSGYVYLDGEFKCTVAKDWDHGDYGMAKDGQVGQLATNEEGNDNMNAAQGYYLLTLDTNAKTYTIEPRNWGVIGNATPGGWNEDTDLKYDPTDLKLKTDITLTDGEIKFRANDDWVFDFGGSLEELIEKGGNIAVTAGNYQIVLDLSTPGPTYKAELIAK